MPRVKIPTEDNGPCDFLRGETHEDSTIAIDSLFLASASVGALDVAASLCREAGAYGLRQDPGFHRRSPRDPMVIVDRGVGFGRRPFSYDVASNSACTTMVVLLFKYLMASWSAVQVPSTPWMTLSPGKCPQPPGLTFWRSRLRLASGGMKYWLDLFTPYTWTKFQEHGASVTGLGLDNVWLPLSA